MEENHKKCSNKKHAEIEAISYCQECKKYFCNKCQNYHVEIHDDHKIINLKDVNEVFIDVCKERNHPNKLELYCKEHNTLCCAGCTSKIKDEGYDQHFDCDVFTLQNIKDEKRNKLKENINYLVQLNAQMDKSFVEIKKISEEFNKNKEELKNRVQNIFTKLRSALSSGILSSCSYDKTIKLFNIKDVQYEILQSLNYHNSYVYKIIEPKNKMLVSCSDDLIFIINISIIIAVNSRSTIIITIFNSSIINFRVFTFSNFISFFN